MRRRLATMTAAVALCSAVLTGAGAAAETGNPVTAGAAAQPGAPATARTAALSAAWGTAGEVPGSQPLNKAGQAAIGSVSCPATTACSAGGSYSAGLNGRVPIVEAFVVNKTGGIWRRAQEVPGTAALNTAGRARVNSVSCAAPGDCSAGGVYSDASGHQQAFVVTETGGTWGTAIKVPGSGSLNAGGYAQINSVSCGSAGNCTAAGYYASGSPGGIPATQAMIVNETGGAWGTAIEVPGTAALNSGASAQVYSVSCAAAGNCSAGGAYTTSSAATQAFIVNETGGTWGTAKVVRGIAALNKGKLAQVSSVSCASPGNCSAGGSYQDASFNSQAFVVDEAGGTWGTAQELPGTAALDQGSPGATVVSLSCAAAGACSAGGAYSDASDLQQAFVADESGGTWGTAQEVPGTAALNTGGLAGTQAVSCAPAGDCSAGGDYTNANMNTQVFVVSQTGT